MRLYHFFQHFDSFFQTDFEIKPWRKIYFDLRVLSVFIFEVFDLSRSQTLLICLYFIFVCRLSSSTKESESLFVPKLYHFVYHFFSLWNLCFLSFVKQSLLFGIEKLMLENTTVIWTCDLVEIIHVELSDKRGNLIMAEIAGQNFICESLFVVYSNSHLACIPAHDLGIFFWLYRLYAYSQNVQKSD